MYFTVLVGWQELGSEQAQATLYCLEVLPLQLLEPEPGDHARGPSSWKFRGWTPYNIAWPGCES